MPNASRKPSDRPERRESSRAPISQGPKSIARLNEALADAEKMARRVDRVVEEDPFAAALLAREYLSLVEELDVNPLNQRGRTDAWTSAFVRLRFAAKLINNHERRADGEAYLVARAEERRLFTMFGKAPRAQLTSVRNEARSKRRQGRALRLGAWLAIAGAVAVLGVAVFFGHVWLAILGAAVGGGLAMAAFTTADAVGRAFAKLMQRATELERGISGLAAFEKSDEGRGILQKIQREHPLLLRTSLGENSSAPPPASGPVRRAP
jgi:hypothetical protein